MGAAGLLPSLAHAAPSVDVIVIGAGLAGLNAALILQGEGARVTVLEGAHRIGGRVHTADGIVSRPEYGASQIGRSYARVLDTVRRLGVPLDTEDRKLLPFATHLGGRWITANDWPSSDLNPLPEGLRTTPPALVIAKLLGAVSPLKSSSDWLDPAAAGHDKSIAEVLRGVGYSEAVLHLASLTAASMDGVSALAMMQELNRGRIDADFGKNVAPAAGELPPVSNVRGGTSRLAEAMHAALHQPARLGKVVARIDMQGKRVVVDCLDGTNYTADFVIAAIPFALLRHIEVRPGFTGLQAEAVQSLPTLDTTRAFLTIREPFWELDGLEPSFVSDGPIEMFWAIDNHQRRGAYRGMMIMTGDRASRLSSIEPADVPAFLLTELARLRPAAAGKIDMHTWNAWAANPLIRCCRHMYGPGQISRLAGPMIRPWQRLHVAGEHTRRNDYGMEAAMESGERAALEVLTGSADA